MKATFIMKIAFKLISYRETWGSLHCSGKDLGFFSSKQSLHDSMSIKDAERHAKILSKIEKFKEDKILEELK